MKKVLIVLVIILLIVVGGFYFFKKTDVLSENNFEFAQIKKGGVSQKVTATGTLQPINVVSVGTQVSGIIEKVLVDYNDEVTEGQLLAEIDKFLLQETLNEALANLNLMKSKLKIAQINYNRFDDLFNKKLISKSEMEQAEIELISAEANLETAEANYKKAKQNIDYTLITSPISGTIISKEVEEGQTVASSFSTPTLFKIAEDLKLMQIEASVSEADIGKITPTMEAEFTVDAYPNDVFKGTVRQVRLNPVEEQNVVMYTVIIDVPNEDKKLLPGMTSFVTIVSDEKDNVLRVPNTSIQFKPSAFLRQKIKGTGPDSLKPNQAVVYLFQGGYIFPKVIELGLTDVMYSEVKTGLKEGDKIISEYISNPQKTKDSP